MDPDRDALIERINHTMIRGIPFNLALDLRVEEASLDGVAAMRLPYRADLVGNPETGVLHGGMVTSLMDACCGLAAFLRTGGAQRIATLDLRIDYLRTARPPADVVARAECYKLTRHVAFVRALAHDGDAADLVAAASATFVIFDRGRAHG